MDIPKLDNPKKVAAAVFLGTTLLLARVGVTEAQGGEPLASTPTPNPEQPNVDTILDNRDTIHAELEVILTDLWRGLERGEAVDLQPGEDNTTYVLRNAYPRYSELLARYGIPGISPEEFAMLVVDGSAVLGLDEADYWGSYFPISVICHQLYLPVGGIGFVDWRELSMAGTAGRAVFRDLGCGGDENAPGSRRIIQSANSLEVWQAVRASYMYARQQIGIVLAPVLRGEVTGNSLDSHVTFATGGIAQPPVLEPAGFEGTLMTDAEFAAVVDRMFANNPCVIFPGSTAYRIRASDADAVLCERADMSLGAGETYFPPFWEIIEQLRALVPELANNIQVQMVIGNTCPGDAVSLSVTDANGQEVCISGNRPYVVFIDFHEGNPSSIGVLLALISAFAALGVAVVLRHRGKVRAREEITTQAAEIIEELRPYLTVADPQSEITSVNGLADLGAAMMKYGKVLSREIVDEIVVQLEVENANAVQAGRTVWDINLARARLRELRQFSSEPLNKKNHPYREIVQSFFAYTKAVDSVGHDDQLKAFWSTQCGSSFRNIPELRLMGESPSIRETTEEPVIEITFTTDEYGTRLYHSIEELSRAVGESFPAARREISKILNSGLRAQGDKYSALEDVVSRRSKRVSKIDQLSHGEVMYTVSCRLSEKQELIICFDLQNGTADVLLETRKDFSPDHSAEISAKLEEVEELARRNTQTVSLLVQEAHELLGLEFEEEQFEVGAVANYIVGFCNRSFTQQERQNLATFLSRVEVYPRLKAAIKREIERQLRNCGVVVTNDCPNNENVFELYGNLIAARIFDYLSMTSGTGRGDWEAFTAFPDKYAFVFSEDVEASPLKQTAAKSWLGRQKLRLCIFQVQAKGQEENRCLRIVVTPDFH